MFALKEAIKSQSEQIYSILSDVQTSEGKLACLFIALGGIPFQFNYTLKVTVSEFHETWCICST